MPATSNPTLPKPTLPPFWKWLMRGTFAVTMALFLAPAVYVVKYYAVDKPEEQKEIRAADNPFVPASNILLQAKYLPLMESRAKHQAEIDRLKAIRRIGETLRLPYISVKRPLECLTAKATLADLAVKDKDPAVRAAASEELGKVAQGGAVIRR